MSSTWISVGLLIWGGGLSLGRLKYDAVVRRSAVYGIFWLPDRGKGARLQPKIGQRGTQRSSAILNETLLLRRLLYPFHYFTVIMES